MTLVPLYRIVFYTDNKFCAATAFLTISEIRIVFKQNAMPCGQNRGILRVMGRNDNMNTKYSPVI